MLFFQFSTKPNMSDEYFNEVALLKKELENEKGFISAERYKSTTNKDSYVSISTWKDKKSLLKGGTKIKNINFPKIKVKKKSSNHLEYACSRSI